MNPIDTSKFTIESLKFIFNEADKLQTNLLKSISENTTKSFFLFAVYSSLLSYAFVKLIANETHYIILVFGAFFGIYMIKNNLAPMTVNFNGALPENMLDSYFDQFQGEELEKEYLATQIESYNSAMNENKVKIEKMGGDFIYSAIILVLTLLVFGAIACLLRFVECPNT